MTPDLFVLEWSQRQNLFHLHPVAAAVNKNRASFAGNVGTDYIPIHVGSRASCEEMADEIRYILKKRDGVEA